MINNQLQSPVTVKNSVISGQGTEESRLEGGKQQGGLFKLLMNSVQGGEQAGKKGQTSGANFLGGNLTLNTSKKVEDEQSPMHLLAGSDDGSKEEKITLSKLLEGSGSTLDSTSKEGSNEEVNAEAATDSDENSTEADGKNDNSEDGSSDGEQQESDSETADLTTEVATQDTSEEQSQADASDAKSGQATSIDGEQKSVQKSGGNPENKSDQVSPAGEIAGKEETTKHSGEDVKVNSKAQSSNQQGAAPAPVGEAVIKAGGSQGSTQQQTTPISGKPVTDGSGSLGSDQQVTTGDSKESNLLNGMIADKESSEKGKQTGFGALLNGEKVAESMRSSDGHVHAEGNSNERPDLVKSEGLVKELRALAFAQGEQLVAGQQQRRVPTEQLNEAAGSVAKEGGTLIQEIFSALQGGSIEQAAAEIRSIKASQLRETKYSNYMSSFANRQEISGSGSALTSGEGSSSSSATAGSTATMMPVSAMVPVGSSVSSDMLDENGAVLWKEQITEYFESNEKTAAENQAAAAFAKLGEVPVTNISVRRSFAKGISQAIIHTTGQGKKGSEVWQKHNFVLEDGKNIQVSAREAEGVLHLKLSSSFTELNKLLMDHENEIRDLLENELALKIDLQMDGGGDGNATDFFGGSSGQQSGSGSDLLDLGSLKKTKEQIVEEVVPKAIRKFGYNQMEWTV